jgi:hypothetical protein
MAVTLINPAGETVYQSGYVSEPEKESHLITGMEGLWIIIRSFGAGADGTVEGTVRTSLHEMPEPIESRSRSQEISNRTHSKHPNGFSFTNRNSASFICDSKNLKGFWDASLTVRDGMELVLISESVAEEAAVDLKLTSPDGDEILVSFNGIDSEPPEVTPFIEGMRYEETPLGKSVLVIPMREGKWMYSCTGTFTGEYMSIRGNVRYKEAQ